MEMKIKLDSHGGMGTWKSGDKIVSFPGYPCFDYLAGSEIIECGTNHVSSVLTLKYGPNTIQPGAVKTLYLGPNTLIVERNSCGTNEAGQD
jgi:hypothetical protein